MGPIPSERKKTFNIPAKDLCDEHCGLKMDTYFEFYKTQQQPCIEYSLGVPKEMTR